MMNPKVMYSRWVLLLLLFAHQQGRAKPVTNVQTLSKWLEEDLEQPAGSEETEQDQDETLLTGALEQQDAVSGKEQKGPFERMLRGQAGPDRGSEWAGVLKGSPAAGPFAGRTHRLPERQPTPSFIAKASPPSSKNLHTSCLCPPP
ncbi:Hypothetical predicted protein [Podarcis lilfordi]|uniref:Uncharacterized protein n=1 Tax=Podarcis lilfordi TaxID=74358 RepID=A0AA35KRN2_9SAUR|nr:Hypothetical predicted protein [Podarcis lilfordi]